MRTPSKGSHSSTLLQRNAAIRAETPAISHGEGPSSADADWSDKTDWPFRFGKGRSGNVTMQDVMENPDRMRWLEANDVHTQFFDAGIGCCWFAGKGEDEPVVGETEDAAIRQLAQTRGLTLWDEV